MQSFFLDGYFHRTGDISIGFQFSNGGGYFNIRTSTKKRRDEAPAYRAFDESGVAFILQVKRYSYILIQRLRVFHQSGMYYPGECFSAHDASTLRDTISSKIHGTFT